MAIIANTKVTNRFGDDVLIGDGTNREINIPVAIIKQEAG